MFKAVLRFQDEARLELDVAVDESVVDAAMRADIPLRYDCTTGECGACLGYCRTPNAATGERAAIVTEAEAAEGLVATCQTRLTGDAEFSFDYPLVPLPSEPMRLRASVASHERLCDTVSRLVLALDDPEDFRFQPGQYLRLRPPGLKVARAYSIASSMDDLPNIELLIRHLDGGAVSAWLAADAAPGDRVVLQAPLGGFAPDTRAARQIFIAGGTGLAPMLAMIRAQRDTGRDLLLCFGCTRAEELFYHDELVTLAASVPGLEVRVALMEGARGTIREGTALALLAAEDLVPGAVCHLCGPPAIVDAARAFLRDHGVGQHSIRAERFAVGV